MEFDSIFASDFVPLLLVIPCVILLLLFGYLVGSLLNRQSRFRDIELLTASQSGSVSDTPTKPRNPGVNGYNS